MDVQREDVTVTQRVRRWLFGCTEVVVGTIEADVAPPPPSAAEAGRAALERAIRREATDG